MPIKITKAPLPYGELYNKCKHRIMFTKHRGFTSNLLVQTKTQLIIYRRHIMKRTTKVYNVKLKSALNNSLLKLYMETKCKNIFFIH